jgi:hypothetical protein
LFLILFVAHATRFDPYFLGHHQAHDEYKHIGNKTIQLTNACIYHAPDDDPKIGVETCSVSNN